MLSRRTKCRISAGVGAACAIVGLTLLTAPSATAGGCANANTNVEALSKTQVRNSIVCLFNNARSAQDVLQDGNLQLAAQQHTDKMRSEQCFSHQCPGEPNLRRRVKNTGYFNGAGQVAEIIAVGDNKSPNDFVQKWLSSNAHRAIIQNSVYRDVGVGVNLSGPGDPLITAVFGKS